ncbi:galactose oxidase [Gigaspora margarita]|uniref:Galactose oxidase n=1 Tax=Gigaspora margarita TaxID=4874 RepID=A0A8H4AZL0_GIGMA|nr:galactose oxidase [Gigaspora margarita]
MNLFQNIKTFLLIIILLFSFVNCKDIPKPRYRQTSSLIGNRLYFFGGDFSTTDLIYDNSANITNEVWYLDLSSSFDTATPPWNKDVGMPIGYVFGASCVSPIDNSVFLVGGRMFIPNTANVNLSSSPVYVFNSNISLWTTPNIIGFNSSFKMRTEIQPVIDSYGKIYTFGGNNYTYSNVPYADYNDMSTLDTTSMIWFTLPKFANTPLPFFDYTATLLPNGIIVYIGGFKSTPPDQYEAVSMYEIQTFNTINYSWSTKNANGTYIDTRAYHSAVLTQNGEIIIYGGSMWNDTSKPAAPYLAKLDTNSWMWSITNLSQINAPQLCYHSAALYGDYMIIAFGLNPSLSPNSNSTLSNNLYILDIKNYTWVTSFNTIQPLPPTSYPYGLFIGIGIGAGIILFGVVGFLLYKWIKQRKYQKYIATPGTTADNAIV